MNAAEEPRQRRAEADTGKRKKVSVSAGSPHRLMHRLDRLLSNRIARAVALAGFLGVLALLLGPPLTGSESSAPGYVVGNRAETNIKATRNFVVEPTESELEAKRLEAEKKVPAVFDHEASLGGALLARVSRAFRALVPAEKGQQPTKADPDPAKSLDTRQGEAKKKVAGGSALDGTDAEVAKLGSRTGEGPSKPKTKAALLDDQREVFAKALGVDVDQETFRLLRNSRHLSNVSGMMLAIISQVMDQLVVTHRGIITPYGKGPISIRHDDGRDRDLLAKLGDIKDLKWVKHQLPTLVIAYGHRLPREMQDAAEGLLLKIIRPNLTLNQQETRKARDGARAKVTPVDLAESFHAGQVVVRDGDVITDRHVRILREMGSEYRGISSVQAMLGIGIFAVIFLGVVHRYGTHHFRRLTALRPRDVVVMSLLLLGLLGLTKGIASYFGPPGASGGLYPYLLPIAAGAMLVRAVIGPELSALFAVVLSVLCGLMLDRSLATVVFFLVTSLVGSAGLSRIQSRTSILRAGMIAGLAGAFTAVCLAAVQGEIVVSRMLLTMLAALAGGLLASVSVLGLLPALEYLFAYTTDITLLELANLNHPLMRELMLRTPGTYHHSMVVGSLAEGACTAIGANGLLARVACNYHDVGKTKNPGYFAENFKSAENPHNRLKPSMSGLIIRNHVKDTVEMMRDHGIPELVIDTATQHHGTTMIEFFFHKALEQAESDTDVNPEDYKYPGPSPQTREAGVIMLADGIEAAARSLADPTSDRLQALVQRVINARFADGQLQQCDLTLRDLHLIAKSFLQVLSGIYHQRPTYPWQREQQKKEEEEAKRVAPPTSGLARRPSEAVRRVTTGVKPVSASNGPRGPSPSEQKNVAQGQDSAQNADAEKGGNVGEPQAERPENEGDDRAAKSYEAAEEGKPDIKRLGLN
jgi:putative nucleotidyltransferase with HDIG domain